MDAVVSIQEDCVLDDSLLNDGSIRAHTCPPGTGSSEVDRVLLTGVGLSIPSGLSFEGWERAGRQLAGIVDSSAWWLGDWLVFGKTHYSDRYQIAIRSAGLRYQTLRNYAWVARRFDISRRRTKLTFQHHAEVASRPQKEQDWLLDRAEQECWTTKQLREAMRSTLDDGQNGGDVEISSRIELPNNRVVLWRKAADRAGVEFDKWVMEMLDWAAAEVLGDETSVLTSPT